MLVKKFRKIERKTPVPEFLFLKVSVFSQTLARVFSYEFCEIFKNTFFTEHFRTTASKLTIFLKDSITDVWQGLKYSTRNITRQK